MKNLKPSIKKDERLLIDFCNVKKWNLNTILDLYEKHSIQRDSEDDLIPENYRIRDCNTRHDSQHTYCLIKNYRSKTLQSKIPETFILPSQAKFKKLYNYLQKSQAEYRRFLDSCIKGNLDIPYLNNLIRDIKNSEPMFFTNPKAFSGKVKKKESEFIKWNPVIYLMAHGECIEEAIDLEIIHTVLRREALTFSKIMRCLYPRCLNYFIADRPTTAKYCKDKCRFDHNNIMKKETGYSKKYYSESVKKKRIKGVYIKSTKR